jgi:hypothetical protein
MIGAGQRHASESKSFEGESDALGRVFDACEGIGDVGGRSSLRRAHLRESVLGQPIHRQPSFDPLTGLPFDRLDRAPGRGLGCGYAGRRQRLHGHGETVRKRDLVPAASFIETTSYAG